MSASLIISPSAPNAHAPCIQEVVFQWLNPPRTESIYKETGEGEGEVQGRWRSYSTSEFHESEVSSGLSGRARTALYRTGVSVCASQTKQGSVSLYGCWC